MTYSDGTHAYGLKRVQRAGRTNPQYNSSGLKGRETEKSERHSPFASGSWDFH